MTHPLGHIDLPLRPVPFEMLQAVWDIYMWLFDTTQDLGVLWVPLEKEMEARGDILKCLNGTTCLCVGH